MRILLILASLLISSCATFENNEYIYGIKKGIIEWQGGSEKNETHVAGYSSYANTWHFVNQTSDIPAEQGITFAIEYETNFEDNDIVTLREIVEYPKKGLTNPSTGRTEYSSFLEHQTQGKDKTIMFYRLSEEWEVVEGLWVFRVEANGKEILREAFSVKGI